MVIHFSLVTTTFNERERLEDTIQDIENQTLQPNEIVIVDAGSKDGTIERLHVWKEESKLSVKLIISEGCNVAQGRNLAIKNAKFDLIASTDFGCRYHINWLHSIIEPFKINPELLVSGGLFTIHENEIKSLASKADYILQNGYKYEMDGNFSVSSRSIAYKKVVWEQIGGYEEWLTLAADDTIFWRLIKKQGFKYVLIDKPYVYWNRHTQNKQFSKEAYRYGLGDGESGINYRNFVSNGIETGIRYSIFPFIYLVLLLKLYYLFIFLPLFVLGLRSYIHAFKNWSSLKSKIYHFGILICSFYQIELCRISYLKGYIKGRFFSSKQIKKNRKELQSRLN